MNSQAPEEAGGEFGYAHSYETSSRYDGPGVRVVLFVSGCLLRCSYCHNPDTWQAFSSVTVVTNANRLRLFNPRRTAS